MRHIYIILPILMFAIGLSSLKAVSFSEDFFGFNTEFDVVLHTESPVSVTSLFELRRINVVFLYGPEWMPLDLRYRGGIGWFIDKPLCLFGGIEWPIYEQLSRFRSKLFGFYLTIDAGIGYLQTTQFEARGFLSVLLPLTAYGGIGIGFGVNQDFDMIIRIGNVAGIYPMEIQRNVR